MAKKKKSHGTKRRRRSHRMGDVGLQQVGTKLLGVAAAAFADNLARKNFTSLNTKILGVAELAIGIFAPKFVKNNKIVEGIGDGLIAVGAINLMKSFSVISGVGAVPARVPLRRAALTPGQPAIGAAGRPYLSQNVGNMAPRKSSHELEMMAGLYAED